MHLLMLLLCLLLPASALAERAPAYVQAAASNVFWGSDALEITLAPDEQACRKAYGQHWAERCAAAPGQTGAMVRGIRMQPAIPGEWRWSAPGIMTFQPEKAWPEKTSFTVDLAGVPIPSHIRVANRQISFSTPPLGAAIAPGETWIDPDPAGERAVSFAVRFSTPPDRQRIEKNTTLTSKNAGLKLGPVQFVWLDDDASCIIRSRILQIPEAESQLTLQLTQAAAMVQKEDVWTIYHNKKPIQSLTFPGSTHLFAIRKAGLGWEMDKAMQDICVLDISTSLRIRPSDLLKQLKIVELPRTQQPEAATPFDWTAAPDISDGDLARGKALRGEALQSDDPASGIRLKIAPTPGSYVFAFLPAGSGPDAKRALARPWRQVFQAAQQEATLTLLQPGSILALGGDRRLDLRTTGLKAVQWRATRILKPMLGLLADNPSPFEGEDSADRLGDVQQGQLAVPATEKGRAGFASLDLSPVFAGGRGLVRLELEGVPTEPGKDGPTVRRLILSTDLGVVDKTAASGERDVYVCSLSSGRPVKGAHVSILGANGLPVAEAETDAQGHAALPPVNGLTREKAPVAVTAALGEDFAWLPLLDESRRVDTSRFDTKGQSSGNNEGLNAFVFSERGIFRPGERLRFGCVVRRSDWAHLPADTPLLAVLRNPAGRVVMQRSFTAGGDGLASFDWASVETAPAGRYTLDIQSPAPDSENGPILGSASVLMQDFQPDTLHVSATLPDHKGWISPQDARLAVELRNLYGLPAQARKIRTQLTISRGELHFPGYETFTFHDAALYAGSSLTRTLPEQTSDKDGKADIPLALEQLRGGTVACTLLVEGFEADGGRAASALRHVLVSPLKTIIGTRPTGAGTNPDFIPQGSDAGIELIALNADLQPVATDELTFSVAERRHVTSLIADASGRYRYDETPVDRELSSSTQRIGTDKAFVWKMPTDAPGFYVLKVSDKAGTMLATVPYTIAGNDDMRLLNGSLPESRLRLHTDKTDYSSGENVQVFLSAPYDGVALLTLERDHVVAHAWLPIKAGNSVHSIAIPENFEGKAYVNVSLARSLASPEIFMEPHSFAVAPIAVNVSRRDLGLQIAAPEKVKPGETAKITLKSRTKGRVILFAVDEGVLQLTRFNTPDPLRALLIDRALEVRTRQMFDLLMPEHRQIAGRLPAFGGGMDLGSGRFDNPFKRKNEPPLSWWSSEIEVGPQGVEAAIPTPGYYNGRIRIMAVGASPDMAGRAEAATLVQGPFILTPQTPALAAPGDRFEAGLLVANNTPEDAAFKLSITADDGITLSDAPRFVSVRAGNEQLIPFNITAGDTPGAPNLHFTLTAGDGTSVSRDASLSIRPAMPFAENLRSGRTGTALEVQDTRSLYPFRADGSLTVSPLPLPAVRGLFRYLEAYPHGCTEQRISRALPYALLNRHQDLLGIAGKPAGEFGKQTRVMTEAALQNLQACLIPSIGVTAWQDTPESASTLLTAYAADYLLALREAGLPVPGGLSNQLFDTLRNAINHAPDSLPEGRAMAYGIWVLTRNGDITAQKIEELAAQLNDLFPQWRKDLTAAFLAGSCSIMRMRSQADVLMRQSMVPGKDFEAGPGMDVLAGQALYVTLLARHFPGQLADHRDELAGALLEAMNANHYMTFSAAQGIRALLALSDTEPGKALAKTRVECLRTRQGFPDSGRPAPVLSEALLTLHAPACEAYRITPPDGQQVYWELSSEGYDRTPPAKPVREGMEISRICLNSAGEEVSTITQGDVVTVQLTVRAYGGPVEDAVITDMLPGGFEMQLPRAGEETAAPGARLDRRDDRMLIFTRLDTEPRTFTYKIRAVNRGTFAVPPAQAESMYNRSLHALSTPGSMYVR